ncbi:3-deoxy-7-phosphoheptulonate synthase [Cyanobacteria bacterium FACHB-DQ100]|uniref:3-deoxy-7-phosphoheptulonate synthase n=1 Tax=unclassified Leptolyngbya TaxID=2650499 RepID=UPI001681C26F|nr:3-deoxy-7-phosphoheptulonate synthase [Leptolyngbya sp. FACHB-17]MBD1824927.1 3-deoxy-7-phosphoheptulonate synthase [Cyanobacteria bacterium FACHB-DQ100]MBD2078769.1 3-deoxy-7-phosphoheptulonate synthase [Leptolyngbya sp. FACHB-17]
MKDARLVRKATPDQRSIVSLSKEVSIGGEEVVIIGGPCAVESLTQMETIARELKSAPIQALRGGVYKPRTSPYAFQGAGLEGLEILATVRQRYDLPVITEVMAISQIEEISAYADMLQVGSRNMQNFDLLKALGQARKPILLKRGLAATIEEFIMAAEYVMSHGNPNVVLCERGIRSFDSYTRNVLDLGAVAALKQLTHLPVIVDPSHAAGRRELIADLSRAAIACGADGLIIECHPEPDQSVSDAQQALSIETMMQLVRSIKPVAEAVGRKMYGVECPQFAIA